MITDQEVLAFRFFRYYRRGILYQAGGIMDQPEPYLQMIDILEDRLGHGG